MLNSLARKPLSLLRGVNLWPRLAVAVTLGFLALFAVLAILILRVVDDGRDRIFQERLVIAELTARQIDGVLGHAFTELENVSASISLHSTGAYSADMSDRLAEARNGLDDRWLGLYLLDDSGSVIAAAPSAGRFAANIGDDSGFRQIGSGARRATSTPYRDAVSGKPATMLMVNLGGSGSGTGLTLGGAVDLSHIEFLQPLNDARSIGDTGHAELVDGRARVVASTDDEEFLAPGEHQRFYLRMQQAGTEGVETVPFESHGQAGDGDNHGDDDHVMAFAQLSNAPWGLAVGGAESETFAPVTDLRNNILLVGAVALAVLWLATLVGARILVRPVRILTGAADKIAEGDLDTPIRVTEGGEIGRLGETLEAMRIRLRASLDESARWTEELEKRVRERTRELESLNRSRAELLGKVISAQEEERKRIARELHDESAQALATLLVELQGMEESLPAPAKEARKRLSQVKSQTTAALTDMRQIILDLRPSVLDELGLVAAVRWYARTHLEATGAGVSLDVKGQQKRVPGSVETAMFRIAQEAINNVAKHAEANNVKVRFEFTDHRVSLLVEDDGGGFDVEAVTSTEDGTARLGLAGMTERATLLGGKAAIESEPGRGTRVSVEVPTKRDMD